MKKNSEYVGVDEKFIPENEKYVNDSVLGDKEKSKKVAKRIGVGYLCFMAVLIAIFLVGFIFTVTNMIKMNKEFDEQFEQQKDRVQQTQQEFDKEVEQQKDKLQQYQQQLEEMYNQGLKK